MLLDMIYTISHDNILTDIFLNKAKLFLSLKIVPILICLIVAVNYDKLPNAFCHISIVFGIILNINA